MDGDSEACDNMQDLGNGGNMNQEDCQQVLLSNLSPPAMSQWIKVQANPFIFKEVQQHYPEHFPMEVRYFLCQWIEEQQWDLIEEDNTEYAEKVLTEMMELLSHKIGELDNPEFFLIRVKLEETVTKLQEIIKTRPYEVIQTITRCLAIEENLIEQLEQSPKQTQINHCPVTDDEQAYGDRIMRDVKSLLHQTKLTENDLKKLQEKQESFIIQFSDSQRITGQLHQLNTLQETAEVAQKKNYLKTQKDKIDVHLTTLAQELYNLRIDLAKKYVKTIDSLMELQKQVLDNALISWKRKQQLAGNGLDMSSTNLDTLQKWCESLADLIWNNRQQMKKAMNLQQQLPIKFPEGEEDLLPKLNDTITTILSSLVTSTFVVEKQPPQVLKKDARFSAIVRFLVGGKLNVHMNPPQVKATIISEQQATHLLKANSDLKTKNNTSGEILNNMGTMEYQPANGKLSINFKNMQLKKIKRADKKGTTEAVTEEKFCIWFQSEFSIGGNELVFQVWTLSLPVVVTVHGNQECNATATILWDNAFAEPARVPFLVPDAVSWKMLSEQLNIKFKSYTGRGLSETNLSYIAFKLFGSKDASTCKVSWAQFNKDTLSNRNFTFWEWFYAIQKLTKEHLKDLWTDNAIIGFVSKKQAENWLSKQPVGTFLLRFSDSELGGITIAWTGEKEVLNLAPFQSKDFSIRGLADRVKDLNNLVTLYPNRLKEDVFSKYYTETNENVNKDGYIHPLLKTTIPEQFKSTTDTDIKQPLSQDSTYDFNLNSVQEMDESIFTPIGEIPSEIAEMDFSQFADYTPEDIDEINVEVIAM